MRIADAWADLVLGGRCPGCDLPAFGLCPGCAAVLRGLRPQRVSRPLPGFPPTSAAGEYTAELRRVLLAAKERQALIQLRPLGGLLAGAIADRLLAGEPEQPVWLVPVPSVRARVIERGLDLTAALATAAARRLRRCGLRVGVLPAVRLVRQLDDQAGLGRQQRLANSTGGYRCRTPMPVGAVVVIDDVVTTGATLVAVTAALRAAGCEPYGAATVAQTPRRGSPKAPAS